MQAKICMCITVLALLAAASGMTVNRMEIEKEKGDNHGSENVLFFEPSQNKIKDGNGMACKNPKYFCSGNRTCCEKGNGTAPSCCPYLQGVCCPDGIHCCPKQSFCDMVHKRCYRASNAVGAEMHSLILASQDLPVLVDNKIKAGNGTACKNPKYFCSANRTCCEKGTGTAPSCCPYSQGVCCPDGIHCCPRQSFCDMAHRRCYRTVNTYEEEMYSMVLASEESLFAPVNHD